MMVIHQNSHPRNARPVVKDWTWTWRPRCEKFASGTRKSTKTEGRIWTWWRKMISLWNGHLNASTFYKSLQCTRDGLCPLAYWFDTRLQYPHRRGPGFCNRARLSVCLSFSHVCTSVWACNSKLQHFKFLQSRSLRRWSLDPDCRVFKPLGDKACWCFDLELQKESKHKDIYIKNKH